MKQVTEAQYITEDSMNTQHINNTVTDPELQLLYNLCYGYFEAFGSNASPNHNFYATDGGLQRRYIVQIHQIICYSERKIITIFCIKKEILFSSIVTINRR
jgi:hypothetical protein